MWRWDEHMDQNLYCPGDADDIMDGFGVVGLATGHQ